MDYRKLGVLPSPEDEASFYKVGREIEGRTREELLKAKSFLSIVSSKSNVSLYDHLLGIIDTVLRYKVEDAVDIIEDISYIVKAQKYRVRGEFLEIPEVDETQLDYINKVTNLFENITGLKRDVNAGIKDPKEYEQSVIEDEDVDDKIEEIAPEVKVTWSPTVFHDVCHHMFRFRQCGVSLGTEETLKLNLSLKALALQFKLENVRFWGKIFGTLCNYYIAEAPYQEGVAFQDYGWTQAFQTEALMEQNQLSWLFANETKEVKQEVVKDEEIKEAEPAVPEGEEKALDESLTVATEKPREYPPLPVPKPPPPSPVLVEKNGKGVNKYMYFVTDSPISTVWSPLPQLRPCHVVHARKLKRLFTGNLETRVPGCIDFQGVEAHYLRAQIARISASTILSPLGYYRQKETTEAEGGEGEGTKEVGAEDSKKAEDSDTEENPEYVSYSTKDLFAEGLNGWVHYRQWISPEGCCSQKNIEKQKPEGEAAAKVEPEQETKDEEGKEQKEKEELPEEIDESPIPRLKPLAEDRGGGGIIPWCLKLSSTFVSESAVLLARSNIWPGAFTYYANSGTFGSVYIGYGHKYSVRHYAPVLGEKWQEEYPIGPDVIEPEDLVPEGEATDKSEGESEIKAEEALK